VIAPGAYGDLLLTRHDPLTDVTHLASPASEIVMVVRSGTITSGSPEPAAALIR
jgi:imidazolonepropionase-like amidohydrolase